MILSEAILQSKAAVIPTLHCHRRQIDTRNIKLWPN